MKVRSKVIRDKSRCADFMPDKSRFLKRKPRRKKTKKHQIKCGWSNINPKWKIKIFKTKAL